MLGTRPGGNIAAAWVALKAMGQDGYMKTAKTLMETTIKLKDAIKQIPVSFLALALVTSPIFSDV